MQQACPTMGKEEQLLLGSGDVAAAHIRKLLLLPPVPV